MVIEEGDGTERSTLVRSKAGREGDIFRPVSSDEGLLSQHAAEQIRALIRSGELRGGDRLPSERELCEHLGVSRTVVREAIKLLKAAGLVRVRLGVGTFIAEPSQNILEGPLSYLLGSDTKKIEDLQQVRSLLEPSIAALAAQSATQADITRMEQAIREMETYSDDPVKYIEADNDFHMALAEASQNSVIQLLVFSLVDLLQVGRQLAVSSPGAVKRARRFHQQILDAVKNGDTEDAFRAMEGHIQQTDKDMWAGYKRRAVNRELLD
jgi:GntR family transcriptional regulator, transcriptional repressor for pyruvate dehydrogenase complex